MIRSARPDGGNSNVEQDYSTTLPELTLVHACVTDPGCKREKNEDAAGFFAGPDGSGAYLMVVADGVGGTLAGEVASHLAVDTIGARIFADGLPARPTHVLKDAITAANEAIRAAASREPRHAGMATTCTAAFLRGQDLVIGHIGDCRAYLIEQGQIRRLTHDHSAAAEMQRRGEYVPPDRPDLANTLTRWLGTEPQVEIDVHQPIVFAAGSTLVLCSDGLVKVVEESEIVRAVSLHLPGGACRKLVDLARERGGPDNITVHVARYRAS
jgi:PPM family protein phosphatase